MRTRFVAAAALLALTLPKTVLPDAAPSPQYAQSLAPRKPTKVEMAGETVKIRLLKDRGIVSASFVLRNTGPEESLEVGFPDVSFLELRLVLDTDQDPRVMLQDFRVSVDGEPQAFVYHGTVEGELSFEAKFMPFQEKALIEALGEMHAVARGPGAGEEKGRERR
ncbi:MAG: hypothetical protein MUC63_09275 [Planctomycetes bacterium]|nr:hypothetical protein [Planctomycetota bacterium]